MNGVIGGGGGVGNECKGQEVGDSSASGRWPALAPGEKVQRDGEVAS